MWNDNETEIDLLGFGDLVDSLDYLLRQEDLLPLTVGVLGDWGSGKNSLMQLAQANLRAPSAPAEEGDEPTPSPFITVAFSPWRFEDFTQVKIALMDAVMSAVEERIKDLPDDSAPKEKFARAKAYLGRFRRFKPLVAPAATGAATGLGALVGLPLPPEVLAILTAAATASTEGGAAGRLSDEDRQKVVAALGSAEQDALKSISEFHVAFEDLLNSLEGVQAVVVFIDDMDRCEERAIIDTFETIRLFLNAKKTAYVLGINEQIVISALEDRYPNRGGDIGSRAQQYLEKMMQASVVIPRLSEAEARSYVSLLYAQKHLPEAEFHKLVEEANQRRAADPYGEAMNIGVVHEVLKDAVDETLQAALEVAAAVAGPLSDGLGLRGNPRQLKRFLNKLEMRLELAKKRGLEDDVRPQVLAKLMVLEELAFPAFERLFIWQSEHDGVAPHLDIAEAVARGEKRKASPERAAAEEWASQPTVQAWLGIEPALAGTPLTPYFTLSRDQLKTSLKTASLTPKQQKMLGALRSPVEALREQAVDDNLGSSEADLLAVADVLLKDFHRAAASDGSWALAYLASKHSGVRADFLAELNKYPPKSLSPQLVLRFSALLGTFPEFIETLTTWQAGVKPDSGIERAIAVQIRKAGGG